MTTRPVPQYLIIYGPPDAPTVYSTAPPDVDEARIALWEAQQRHPCERLRLTSAEAIPLPAD